MRYIRSLLLLGGLLIAFSMAGSTAFAAFPVITPVGTQVTDYQTNAWYDYAVSDTLITAIGNKSIAVGATLNFVPQAAITPDADIVWSVSLATPLSGIGVTNHPTFVDDGATTGTQTATFNWVTSPGTPSPDSGDFYVILIATAGAVADSEMVKITVGAAMHFEISATDADGDNIVWSVDALTPLSGIGATAHPTFTDDGTNPGDATPQLGTFDWTPTAADAGMYYVNLIATAAAEADTQLVVLAVGSGIDTVSIIPRLISSTSDGVRLLAWTYANGSILADTLCTLKMTSFNERAFAGETYTLKAWDNSDSTWYNLKSVLTTGMNLENNDTLFFAGMCHKIDGQTTDSFLIQMDV